MTLIIKIITFSSVVVEINKILISKLLLFLVVRYLSLLIRVTGKHLKSFCCALSERLIAKWHLNRSQLYDSASKAVEVLPTKICTAQNALELF